MPVYKRKGSPFYWYDFTIAGSRFRGSTETSDRALASHIEATLRISALRQAHLGDKPSLTLDQACGKFLTDHARHLKSCEAAIVHYCAHLIRLIGARTPFDQVGDAKVAAYVAARRGEKVRRRQNMVSNTTINREVMTLSSIHSKMRLWGFQVGEITFKNHTLPQPEHRLRWLTAAEARKLIAACGTEYLRQIVRFALMSGARRSNILGMQREDIDLFAGTIAMRVKSAKPGGKPHTLPITSVIKDFLIGDMGWQPGQRGPLFAKKNGQGYVDIKEGFKKACKKAGIKHFRFHDLRHTCASWLVQNGVPLITVKEILGHENIATTMRYAHLHADAKRAGLETIAAQIRHTGSGEKKKPAAAKHRKSLT